MNVNKYYLVDPEKSAGFPCDIPFGKESDYSSDIKNTKLGYAYGLQVAKAIEFDWYGGGDCLFLQRQKRFRELRLYAMGNQPVQKYKDILCFEKGENKWTKLDWTTPKIDTEIC